jgi:dTMP kinase
MQRHDPILIGGSSLMQVSNELSGRGRIIVIEGVDKAGKQTQARLLVESLKLSGRICAVVDFPDYTTPIGKEIKAFLEGNREYPNESKHMLLSANRWERKGKIESMIKKGTIVIMNRYYQSNLVYGVSNGLNINWLANLDSGLPKEDVVIVLDVSHTVLTERSTERELDSFEKNQKLLLEVNRNYRKLAKQFKWKIINGEKSREQIHQEIMNILKIMRIV